MLYEPRDSFVKLPRHEQRKHSQELGIFPSLAPCFHCLPSPWDLSFFLYLLPVVSFPLFGIVLSLTSASENTTNTLPATVISSEWLNTSRLLESVLLYIVLCAVCVYVCVFSAVSLFLLFCGFLVVLCFLCAVCLVTRDTYLLPQVLSFFLVTSVIRSVMCVSSLHRYHTSLFEVL